MIKLAKEKMVKCKVLPMEGEPGEALEIQMFVSQMAMNKIEAIKKNGLGQDNSIYIGRVSAKPEVLQALKDNWRYRLEFTVIENVKKDENGKEVVNARNIKMKGVEFYNLKNSANYFKKENDNVEIRVFAYSFIEI